MSSAGGAQWSQPEQFNTNMAAMSEQDFANMVDLDVFDSFDFLNFDPNSENAGKIPSNIDPNLFSTVAQHQPPAQQNRQSASHALPPASTAFDFNMHINFESAPHDHPFAVPQAAHGMQHHSMVPPTPNSVEMHSDAARFLQQQLDATNRAMLEQHYQMRKGDAMNFTPLGTPAVTPQEAQFNVISEFTVPGAYFSPLTSPALEGQQQNGHHTSASSAATASPVDPDVDMLGESAAPAPASASTRKTRKRPNTPRTSGSRKVAQSPIQKPMQRRKGNLSSVIPPKEMSELLEAHSWGRQSPTSPVAARMPQSHAGSSTESISPEPLSEGVMGPPPKPISAKQSPAILADNRSPSLQANGQAPIPATPASLMRLQQARDSNGNVSVPSTIQEQQGGDGSTLEELTLPEAATADVSRPNLAHLETAIPNGEVTPKLTARKTPKLGPLSTPSSSVSLATKPTLLANTVASPTSGSASPVSSRRPEPKSRMSKKRGSVSGNTLLSPALRPKISPSIKPLLPEGTSLTDDGHTLFLANRSNYQNLIEGTNIPGVSYPSDLPTQLTSKRTSHKIAEQGRRQRINVALQEMQTLLPKTSPIISAKNGPQDDEDDEDDEDGGKRKGGAGGKGGGSSKAATVESAIVYIKTLQKEEIIWRQEREEKEKEVAALKRKLDEMEKQLKGSSAGKPTTRKGSSENGG